MLFSSLYIGQVLHRRYRPKKHELRYNVANLFVDVDQLQELNHRFWLLGYNRLSLFSINDANHGPGDGTPIAHHIRTVMKNSETGDRVARIFMFCYPAVFGKIFNPLTVYLGFDVNENLVAAVYEVNNTFGQRHSYALTANAETSHKADKQFYVSPFNDVAGEYHFTINRSADRFRLNIALFEGPQLKLCARFDGRSKVLSDTALMRRAGQLLLQPLKIFGGIHWEALKLYLKGLRLSPRPAHAKFAVTVTKEK